MTLDLGSTLDWEDPERHEIAFRCRSLLNRAVEKALPRIWIVGCETVLTEPAHDVLPHRMALVAMDASFPLFEIDGVARQVPVHHGVTVQMEVESLLADGR